MIHLLLAIIYIAFISLGLPDSLLGSAWPTMYTDFSVPLFYAGIISMIIAFGTIVSSLQSDRLTKKFGTGKVTAFSVAMTAIALFGFSSSHSFITLCLWAIPYGLGAGSVDASLNNYVALNYSSKHMSWLHCMWGVGATLGPYIMGYALSGNYGWNMGYAIIGVIQVILTFFLFLSLPLWKKQNSSNTIQDKNKSPLTLKQIIQIPGAKAVMICFFCYCALEQTAGLWASSYLMITKGISADVAASFASLFFIGITVGRAVSGFITMKLNDVQMVRMGQLIILIGIIVMVLPLPGMFSLIGLVMIGLGCAPVYPCLIHATPEHFGEDKSQAIIGVQMASAYVGTCVMPPLFGLLTNIISVSIFPLYLLSILIVMFIMHKTLSQQIVK
ncbi:MFS transporter [Anaerorhabdus sp.]|uniref:MFS transporter n=1 Tax=Anaerorhabdus sp. TaxID=1872524 RepID=UPI002FCB5829